MLKKFLQTLREKFSRAPQIEAVKTPQIEAAVKIASTPMVATLVCHYCQRANVPLFRPVMEFWPNRNDFPYAKAVTLNMGRPTCEPCREKLAWHNLANQNECETIAAALMKRYGNNARPDFKATRLTWLTW
jgi:hypothetical protein